MSDANTYTPPPGSPIPFSGDRGWKTLDRSPGEGTAFVAIVVLLVAAILSLLLGGVTGLGMVFLAMTFATIAVILVISMGG